MAGGLKVVLVVSSKSDWKRQLQDRGWRFVTFAPIARVPRPTSVLIAAGGQIVGQVRVGRLSTQGGGRTAFGKKDYPSDHALHVLHLDGSSAKSESRPWSPSFDGRRFRLVPGTHHYLLGKDLLNSSTAELQTPTTAHRDPVFLPRSAKEEASAVGRERELVRRFERFMASSGRQVELERPLRGGLRIDVWVPDGSTMIEAKWPLEETGVPLTRVAVRLAIGQLLDYRQAARSSLGPVVTMAVLVPTKPEPPVMELLSSVRIGAIWETTAGRFQDSLGGGWLSGKSKDPVEWSGSVPGR